MLAFSAFLERTPGLGATTADDTENKVPRRNAPRAMAVAHTAVMAVAHRAPRTPHPALCTVHRASFTVGRSHRTAPLPPAGDVCRHRRPPAYLLRAGGLLDVRRQLPRAAGAGGHLSAAPLDLEAAQRHLPPPAREHLVQGAAITLIRFIAVPWSLRRRYIFRLLPVSVFSKVATPSLHGRYTVVTRSLHGLVTRSLHGRHSAVGARLLERGPPQATHRFRRATARVARPRSAA